MIEDVTYTIQRNDGVKQVCGMRVGRFAVRMRLHVELLVGSNGISNWARDYVVDHVPSGLVIGDFSRFDDALRFADDISRFAVADVAARTCEGAIEQLGGLICRWANECNKADRAFAYREWLAARRQAA